MSVYPACLALGHIGDVAKSLLEEASHDDYGQIMKLHVLGGTIIQANKKTFCSPDEVSKRGFDYIDSIKDYEK